MRQRLVKGLKPLHAIAVENTVGSGTPDINYVGGWIECKWLRRWPKRESTIVKLVHDFTREQRLWATSRWACGGASWLMLQCNREWLLFTGVAGAKRIGSCTRLELIKYTHSYWGEGLKDDELRRILSNGTEL